MMPEFLLKIINVTLFKITNYFRYLLMKFKVKGTIKGKSIFLQKGVRFVQTSRGRFNLHGPLWVNRYCSFHADGGVLTIGERTSIGPFTIIAAMKNVTIGSECQIAEYVSIRDHDHAYSTPGVSMIDQGWVIKPIQIGNNVWIGAKATILKGCTVGDNVIIGANSVVTRDIPSNYIVVGSPARLLRTLYPEKNEARV